MLRTLAFVLALGLGSANAQPAPGGFDPGPMQAQINALQSIWNSGMIPRLTAVPVAGPGAGMCQRSIVPANLVSSGGMAGTAGTCAVILQCGTDATPKVEIMNVGNGC